MASTIADKKNEMLFTELLDTINSIDFFPSKEGKVYAIINGLHYVYCSPAVQEAVKNNTFSKESVRYAELLFTSEQNPQGQWQPCLMMIGTRKEKALLSFSK